jgi:hypothetical protein
MKRWLFFTVLSFGAGSLHAFKHVIRNKSNHEWSVSIGYQLDCIPAGAEHEFSSGGIRNLGGINPGQSVTVDSGQCWLRVMSAEGHVLKPCNEQNFSEHLCMPGEQEPRSFWYFAPARTDGDTEYEITESGIKKIK